MKFRKSKIYRFLILPIILLFLMYFIVFLNIGSNDIVASLQEAWGISILLMIVSSVYLEYLFTSPKSAFINSINALIASLGWLFIMPYNFYIAIVYTGSLVLIGLIYLLIYDKGKKINLLSRLVRIGGASNRIFMVIAVLSLLKIDSVNEKLTISTDVYNLIYLFIFYILFLALTSNKLQDKIGNLFSKDYIGRMKDNLLPNIVLLEFSANIVNINDLVILGDNCHINGKKNSNLNEDKIALVLDYVSTESEEGNVLVRAYLLNEPQRLLNYKRKSLIKLGEECRILNEPEKILKDVSSDKIKYYWQRRADIIALISSGSDIDTLKTEMIRYEEVENAELVGIIDKDTSMPIRYQIINETIKSDMNRGFTELTCHQLGEWRKSKDKSGNIIEESYFRFFDFQRVPHYFSPALREIKTLMKSRK